MEEVKNVTPTANNTTMGGQKLTEQQFDAVKNDGSKKLKETAPGQFTVLERMRG